MSVNFITIRYHDIKNVKIDRDYINLSCILLQF